MSEYIEWRLFIGPRFRQTDAYYYYDWTGFVSGAALPAELTVSTQLNGALASGATTATVDSTTNFPSTGGAWIGPGSTLGQGWEYVSYSGKTATQLQNLARESATYREHNGGHDNNAVVKAWWEVTTAEAGLRILGQLDGAYSFSDWTVAISGVSFPQAALKNRHFAAIYKREVAGGSWTLWVFGVLDGAQTRDSWDRTARWSAKIAPVSYMALQDDVPSYRVGNLDLAQAGTVQSSQTLSHPRKEKNSGDYTAAEPSLEPANIVDGTDSTLWIADRFVGSENAPGTYRGPTAIYSKPYPSHGNGYKWVEFAGVTYAPTGDDFGELWLWNPSGGGTTTIVRFTCDVPANEFLILCQDKELFQQDNPEANPHTILDEGDLTYHSGSNFFGNLNPAGGALVRRSNTPPDSGSQYVQWGSVTSTPSGFSGMDIEGDGAEGGWDAYTPPAAADYEMVIRRNHLLSAAKEANNWVTDYVNTAGYIYDDGDSDAWLHITLPAMDAVLRSNVTAGSGRTLYIVDSAGNPTTEGFSNSGNVYIGTDTISYSGRTKEALTGCTLADDHDAGDKVYAFQGSMVTDGYPIDTVTLRRSGDGPDLRYVNIRLAPIIARTPTQDFYTSDATEYLYYRPPSGWTEFDFPLSSFVSGGNFFRARSIIVEIPRMGNDPARPRLNTLEARAYRALFDTDRWAASSTAEDAIEGIMLLAGIPAGKITSGSSTSPSDYAMEPGRSYDIAVDAAEYFGCRIAVGLDSGIEIEENTLWSTAIGGYSPDHTLTEVELAAVELVWNTSRNIKQYRVGWTLPDKSSSGSEVYPASEDSEPGESVEVGPLVFQSSVYAQLYARKRYFMEKYSNTVIAEIAGGDLTIQPHQIMRVRWTVDETVGEVDRTYLVDSVEHTIQYRSDVGHNIVTTIVSGVEIDREAP